MLGCKMYVWRHFRQEHFGLGGVSFDKIGLPVEDEMNFESEEPAIPSVSKKATYFTRFSTYQNSYYINI